jgi:hypothetical protein
MEVLFFLIILYAGVLANQVKWPVVAEGISDVLPNVWFVSALSLVLQ